MVRAFLGASHSKVSVYVFKSGRSGQGSDAYSGRPGPVASPFTCLSLVFARIREALTRGFSVPVGRESVCFSSDLGDLALCPVPEGEVSPSRTRAPEPQSPQAPSDGRGGLTGGGISSKSVGEGRGGPPLLGVSFCPPWDFPGLPQGGIREYSRRPEGTRRPLAAVPSVAGPSPWRTSFSLVFPSSSQNLAHGKQKVRPGDRAPTVEL